MINSYKNTRGFPDPPLPTPDEGPSLETSIVPLSFQVVREPLPFAYNLFNDYFTKIGKILSEKVEISDLEYMNASKPTDNKFDLKTITVEEVLSKLKNLEGNRSSGPDNISPKFLKDSCDIIAPILTIILILTSLLRQKFFPMTGF